MNTTGRNYREFALFAGCGGFFAAMSVASCVYGFQRGDMIGGNLAMNLLFLIAVTGGAAGCAALALTALREFRWDGTRFEWKGIFSTRGLRWDEVRACTYAGPDTYTIAGHRGTVLTIQYRYVRHPDQVRSAIARHLGHLFEAEANRLLERGRTEFVASVTGIEFQRVSWYGNTLSSRIVFCRSRQVRLDHVESVKMFTESHHGRRTMDRFQVVEQDGSCVEFSSRLAGLDVLLSLLQAKAPQARWVDLRDTAPDGSANVPPLVLLEEKLRRVDSQARRMLTITALSMVILVSFLILWARTWANPPDTEKTEFLRRATWEAFQAMAPGFPAIAAYAWLLWRRRRLKEKIARLEETQAGAGEGGVSGCPDTEILIAADSSRHAPARGESLFP